MTAALRIAHLVDVPETAPTLARWFVEEWEPWYGPDGAGDPEADLAACASRNALPICLVALAKDGNTLGTAALKTESVGSETGAGPWLAALLVGPQHRGLGIGTALVDAIEAEARRLGFPAIYCSADASAGILKRRGWQAIGTTESLRGTIAIFCRRL
ncbi:MAG: GNAT family N-acetyltransferase [Alphaproteobacteria bacterium]|nr:GNAT family N-acetyltransferase [Alphaproteobacteria bacterium]